MKKILNLSMMIMLSFVWQHCTEEQAPAKLGDGNVRFALRATSLTAGRVAAEVNEVVNVIVSIRNAAGEEVYTHRYLPLLLLGGNFTTQPLLLKAGEHQLTEFLVVRADGTVIFAAPLEGSELASLVQDPLPQSFFVGPEAITNLNVEVLDTENQVPEAFGYVTFGFTEVPSPVFQLSIIKQEGQGFVLSRAHVYLVEDGDTIFYQYVPGRINTINFVPHPDAQYRLMLYEDGFRRYDQYFQLDDLSGELLEVTLQPALTFVVNNRHTFFLHVITLDISEDHGGAAFWVDWGDGISAGYYTIPQIQNGLIYNYLDNKPHFVSVSEGNLNAIRGVSFDNVQGGLDALSVQHLPALKSLNFSTSGLATIDISHNPQLEQLYAGSTSISSLDISENPLLKHVNLSGTPFTTASIDAFVDALYQNVVIESSGFPRNGQLDIRWGEGVAIGPPSEASRVKLSTLVNQYGWSVWPIEIIYL